MVTFLFLLLKVFSYNIYSIGFDAEYDLAIKTSMNEIAGLNFYFNLNDSSELKRLNYDSISMIIVITQDIIEHKTLKAYSETYLIPLIFLESGSPSLYTFYTNLAFKCVSEAIISVFEYFSLSRPSIVWPYSSENLNIIQSIRQTSPSSFIQLSLLPSQTSQQVSTTLNKILKQQAIQNYIFLPHETFCSILSEAFQTSFLVQKGNFALFFSSCIYQVSLSGSLILTESGSELIETQKDYKTWQIKKIFRIFSKTGLSNEEIVMRLEEELNGKCKFNIVNLKNSTREVVGEVDEGQVKVFESIVYLGGVMDRTSFNASRVVVSANTGSFNPNGQPPVYSNVDYHQGSYFAVEKINRDHKILPRHSAYLYDKVDCGITIFDYNYSRDCFRKHRPEMGVAYVPTLFSMNLPLQKQLYSLNLTIPFISGMGSSGLLSNSSEFPYFVRTVSPSSQFSIAWANLIRLYGWTKIAAHYTNDSFGTAAYNVLLNCQSEFGFKFINNEKYRSVGYVYDHDSLTAYHENMRDSINLGCNLIFLIMGDPAAFFWLEGFYDLGVRRGDFTFVFFTVTGLTNFKAANADLKKRKELMHGSLVIFNAAWVGEYGEAVKQEYLKYRNDSWGRSYYIDTVFSAVETTGFLLNQGKAYEDISVFMQALRNIRFVGATGIVSFESGTNDRNLATFNLFNFYEDDLGNWHDDAVALISPLGTVYYTVLKETVWVNGELPKPMKNNYLNCPFRKDQIQRSEPALKIKIGVSVTVLLITSILSLYSFKNMRIKYLNPLRIKSYIVFEDYVTFGFILLEGFQMLSIGPSFQSFNSFLSDLSAMLSMNLSKLATFKDNTFWIIFYSMVILSYTWTAMILFSHFRIFKFFNKLYKKLDSFNLIMIPIMSNYLFMPTIVCLISILMCDNAISQDYTDSYLNYDCNLFCWKDAHLTYSVLACFQIVVYIPIAIYYRTLWQEQHYGINIRTSSKFLILKNIAVVVLVVVGKILKDDYQLAHGLIFLSIIIILFLSIIIIKLPYNYDRANLWCKVILICVIWNTVVCIASNNLMNENLVSVILQFSGWIVIVLSGFYFQTRLPENMLVSKKGRSIVDLFRFAFGLGSYKESRYVFEEEQDFVNLCQEGSNPQ